jgi:hypothetical protein
MSYPSPMHRAYIIKCIPFTAPNSYHVVDVATKITHSMWDDLMKAKQCAADMNLAIKRERTMVVARAKRLERESHLRLVK